jgi:membrane-associated phospholipid phosphatase
VTSGGEHLPPDLRGRRRNGTLVLGVVGVAVALVLGVLVGPAGNPVDDAVTRTLGRWCGVPTCRAVIEPMADEGGWPFGAYVTAAVPLVVVCGLLLAEGLRPEVRTAALRWLLLVLVAVAVQETLSRLYGRVGPFAGPDDAPHAYPSGAALLVALGWLGGGMVAAELRPGWRRAWWVATAGALLGHALVRAATGKHWATDIAGSYLLVAGMVALVSWFAGRVAQGNGTRPSSW